MALATQADVEADLGRGLSESEQQRLPSLLTKATALVVGYVGQDFEPGPYPAPVVVIAAEMVARVLTASSVAPVLPEQQSAGPFAVRYSSNVTSGGPWLTAGDKIALRPYRRGGGMTSVGLVGDRYSITEA